MQLAIYFLILVLAVDAILLIAGLFKPTLVVWWEDIQNRRRVLRIYGRTGFFLSLLIAILLLFNN